jgi:hypothetical protein
MLRVQAVDPAGQLQGIPQDVGVADDAVGLIVVGQDTEP